MFGRGRAAGSDQSPRDDPDAARPLRDAFPGDSSTMLGDPSALEANIADGCSEWAR
jgi:hypothetical protein